MARAPTWRSSGLANATTSWTPAISTPSSSALRLHSPKDDEARKCIDYVERNRERMRYPTFRAAGLCTSTGVVEAGCKVAIGTRCKRAGMHWSVAGVDAIIALRCCKLSGRFEAFWERRAQRRVA